MTTQEITDMVSEYKTEDQLWTEFTVLEARRVACWQLGKHAWREHVRSSLNGRNEVTWRVYRRVIDLYDMWQGKRDAAYAAWQRVAYPLYGWPLPDND